jgi:hypothetical protein
MSLPSVHADPRRRHAQRDVHPGQPRRRIVIIGGTGTRARSRSRSSPRSTTCCRRRRVPMHCSANTEPDGRTSRCSSA